MNSKRRGQIRRQGCRHKVRARIFQNPLVLKNEFTENLLPGGQRKGRAKTFKKPVLFEHSFWTVRKMTRGHFSNAFLLTVTFISCMFLFIETSCLLCVRDWKGAGGVGTLCQWRRKPEPCKARRRPVRRDART